MGRDRLLKELLRERFIVTMKTGETFDGLLNRWDESTVEVVAVSAFTDKGERYPVDGTMYLPRDGVAYMQRPTG